MIAKKYLVSCPNCKEEYSLYTETDEKIELNEGEQVIQDRRYICSCNARIDEWSMVTMKNGKIELSAGIKGFIVPSAYVTINKRYE